MTNQAAIRTLNARLITQRLELNTCKTVAAFRCVEQAMADTMRQMRELMGLQQAQR